MAVLSLFNDLSIGKKLVGGFLAAALITGVVGGIGFFRISSTMEGLQNLVDEEVLFLKQTQALAQQTALATPGDQPEHCRYPGHHPGVGDGHWWHYPGD